MTKLLSIKQIWKKDLNYNKKSRMTNRETPKVANLLL